MLPKALQTFIAYTKYAAVGQYSISNTTGLHVEHDFFDMPQVLVLMAANVFTD